MTFPIFSSLPLDIRRVVYSKFLLEDRFSLGRASTEAFSFFTEPWNLWKISPLIMYVSKISGKATLTIKYGAECVERITLPAEIDMSKELESYNDCGCKWCEDWEEYTNEQIRRFPLHGDKPSKALDKIRTRVYECGSLKMNLVFLPLLFIRTTRQFIRTQPYGGFVETISPLFPLIPDFHSVIYWHVKNQSEPASSLNITMWNKWLELPEASRNPITFDAENLKSLVFCTPDEKGTISEDIFTLDAAKNASELDILGKVTIRENQLLSLRNHGIFMRHYFSRDLSHFSNGSALEFFKRKIEVWVGNPEVSMTYDLPPSMKFCAEQLLEDVHHKLVRPNIHVYFNIRCLPWGHGNDDNIEGIWSITIRNLQTNSILFVSGQRLSSSGPIDEEQSTIIWPRQ